MAKASGLGLAGNDLDRAANTLEALERVFRPLVKDLPSDLEPVLEFRAEAGAE